MATTTIVQLTDDLDGSKADRAVGFSLDGVGYEMATYIEAARRVGGRAAAGRVRITRTSVALTPAPCAPGLPATGSR